MAIDFVTSKKICFIAEIVARVGKDKKLPLPKAPKGSKVVNKTSSEAINEYQHIAKKTLNIWLTKLRKKYRPKTKKTNETKKNGGETEPAADESGGESTENEESYESE